eukprot:5566907-Amphidinium_carterae.1
MAAQKQRCGRKRIPDLCATLKDVDPSTDRTGRLNSMEVGYRMTWIGLVLQLLRKDVEVLVVGGVEQVVECTRYARSGCRRSCWCCKWIVTCGIGGRWLL